MKKSILIVNNGVILKNNNTYFTESGSNNFINDLSDLHFDVTLMQFVSNMDNHTHILGSEIETPIIKLSFYNNNFLKLISYFFAFLKALKSIRNFDFVYVFFPGHLPALTILACLILKKKFGLYVRGDFKSSSFLNQKILTNCSLVITNNLLFRNKIIPFNEKCNIVLSYKRLGNVIPEINDFDKIENTSLRVLFVGRVEKAKGFHELIKACLDVYDRNNKFSVDVIGGGDLFAHYAFEHYDLISHFINFHGPIHDRLVINDYYRKADIFLFPTYTEAFPRVLYDAMRFKVAVVTTFVGGISSVFKDNDNCMKIKTKSFESIAEKLEFLILNNDFRVRIAFNGFSTLKELFFKYKISHKMIINNYLKDL